MDLRQLRYFTQIVESGSLSRASRQLYIAQPALSQQLSKLEAEVGKPLLTRSPKGVAPTENGLALYHHARFMLRQLDQALSIARKDSGAVQGILAASVDASMASVAPVEEDRLKGWLSAAGEFAWNGETAMTPGEGVGPESPTIDGPSLAPWFLSIALLSRRFSHAVRHASAPVGVLR